MSAESFIKRSFCMHVAAVCSEETELRVRKNNLTFCEMLRPFCHLSVDVPIRDPQGHTYNAKDIHVRVVEPMADGHSDSKLRLILDSTVRWTESKIAETERRKAHSPWYDFYRDTFIENMSVSNHDLLRHFVCTLFVVTSDSEDPIAELTDLREKVDALKQSSSHSRWLPQSVDYCVVLRDSSQSDPARDTGVLEQVRRSFGRHCTLLTINSVTADSAVASGKRSFLDPWSRILQRESHTGEEGGSLSAARLPLPPPPPLTHTTTLHGTPVPNGPLISLEVREEAELIDVNGNDSPQSSLAAVKDPLLHLEKTDAPPSAIGFGQFLSIDDHEGLRKFVMELTRQTLIPTLCSVQKSLGELVQARRGGFQKMWKSFRNMASNSPTAPPLYHNDSQEAQTRLLADVSMLLQNYEHAYQLYHSLKGDFKADKAWLNYAGAMELAAVSCFMSSRKLLTSYLDEATTFYLNHADSNHFAFRAMLIHCELLKGHHRYKEAAQVFLRMSLGVKNSFLASSDLKVALALEETANCYLLAGMARQYSLYVFMAAHRHIKARQMVHGARALNQALGVLREKDWSLSEVFLQTSLARHYWQCHRYQEAWQSFELVLSKADQRQSPSAQQPLFKEYIHALKHLFGSSAQQACFSGPWSTAASVTLTEGLPRLVIPEVLSSRTKVLLSAMETCPGCPEVTTSERQPALAGNDDVGVVEEPSGDCSGGMSLSRLIRASASLSKDPSLFSVRLEGSAVHRLSPADMQRHRRLEEGLTRTCSGVRRVALDLEPCVLHMDATTDNTRRPYCIINEPVYVEVSVMNRLLIPLQLTNVTLIWKLEPELPGTPVDPENAALGEVIPSVTLYPLEEKQIHFHMVPLKEGVLHVTGLVYTLQLYQTSPNVPQKRTEATPAGGTLSLASHGDVGGIQGQRDLSVRGLRLNRTIVERTSVMYGPDHRLSWTIRPTAPRLKVLMEKFPSWMLAGEVCQVPISFSNCGWRDLQSLYLATSLPENFTVIREVSTAAGSNDPSPPPSPSSHHHQFNLPEGGLPPGGNHHGGVLVQAPPRHAHYTWDWLYYYIPAKEVKGMSHRIVPFTAHVDVRPSLNVTCAVHESCVTPDSMGDSMLLTLEVENVCQVDGGKKQPVTMSVYQVSCISWDGWTVSPLDTRQGVLNVFPDQCGHVALKASQPVCEGEGREEEEELQFCDLALGEEKVSCGLFPAVDLFRRSRAFKELCASPAPGKQRKKLALAVFWKASLSHKEGTRHAHGIHFTPVNAVAHGTVRVQSIAPRIHQDGVVQWFLRHPPSVAHDFSKNRILLIPVELTLLNPSASREISVQVNLHSDASTAAQHDDAPPIQWVGTTEWRVPRLKARETLTVLRHVCITSPDVYPISPLVRVSTVRPSSGRSMQNAPPIYVPQVCPQSAVITVTNLAH